MNENFKNLFNRQPNEIINGDYYFNADSDGDNFNAKDAELWLSGVFKDRWKSAVKADNGLVKAFYADVLNIFAQNPSPFMEIACGPGMGLTPIILSRNPGALCLATDACSLLVKSLRQHISSNLKQFNIDLASFSIFDIPMQANSLDIVTSFIGVSSTRSGEQGKLKALSEIYRVLKKGGCFIAVENEWLDIEAIRKVFRLWGRNMWVGMEEETSWNEKFKKSGFTVEKSDKTFFRYLTGYDNELGEQAERYGVKVGMKYTLFVLRK